jgi:hypothetical protein
MRVKQDGNITRVKVSCVPTKPVLGHQFIEKLAELPVAPREVRIARIKNAAEGIAIIPK